MNKKNSLTTLFLLVCILASVLAYLNFVDIEPLQEPSKNQAQILNEKELNFYKNHVKQNSFCRKSTLTTDDFEILNLLANLGDFKAPIEQDDNFLTPGFICFVRDTVWKNYFSYIETVATKNKEQAAQMLNQYIFLVTKMITNDWLLFDRYYEMKALNEQLIWIQNSKIKKLLDKNKSLALLKDINFIEFIKDSAEKEKWLNFSLIRKANPKIFVLINSKNGFTQKDTSIFFQKNRTHDLINKNWDHQILNLENCMSQKKSDQPNELQSLCLKDYKKYETSMSQKYLYNIDGASTINNSKQLELQQLFLQFYSELNKFLKLEKNL